MYLIVFNFIRYNNYFKSFKIRNQINSRSPSRIVQKYYLENLTYFKKILLTKRRKFHLQGISHSIIIRSSFNYCLIIIQLSSDYH